VASPLIPHLDWPVRVGANGHLVANEQDSIDDIASCVAISLMTPPGYRVDEPDFGSRPDFVTLPINVGAFLQQIERDEPRAALDFSDDDAARENLELRVQLRLSLARGAS
jgi:phage baseplate assembly protein W